MDDLGKLLLFLLGSAITWCVASIISSALKRRRVKQHVVVGEGSFSIQAGGDIELNGHTLKINGKNITKLSGNREVTEVVTDEHHITIKRNNK